MPYCHVIKPCDKIKKEFSFTYKKESFVYFFHLYFFFYEKLKQWEGFQHSLNAKYEGDFYVESEFLDYRDKETFYRKKHSIKPSACFEQFLLYSFLHNGKPITYKLQTEDIDNILEKYPIDFPENIKKQFFRECRSILESFVGMEKDKIIQHLIQYTHLWDECNVNALFVSILLKWVGGDAKEWMLKMLKIFILGMVPNIEKRKKGTEFFNMVNNHFYDFSLRF
jgi:hypothetical protein